MSDVSLSPDAIPPVDLTLYDRTPEDLRTLGITYAATALPDWTPREGNTEVVLLDAFALVVSEYIYAVNRLLPGVLDNVFQLMGIARDPGAPATVQVTFHLADDDGHTIPAGTRVRLDVQSGGLVFALDEPAVAGIGETTVTAPATATTTGAAANGVDPGAPLPLIDPVFFVNSAETATTVINGREPEDQAAWELRASQRLIRLSDVLVLPAQFTAAALEHPPIHRATTIGSYNGSGGPPYTHGGHVTVVVRGPSGNVSSEDKGVLVADLEARVVAGVEIHVIDATLTDVDVDATIAVKPGYVPADIIAAVTTALDAYLDPGTWPWATTVRRNELISLIDQVAGVDYVDSLTVPATDVTLAGDGPLPTAGDITISEAT